MSLEFDGTLNGSRVWTGSQHQRHEHDHDLAVRLTTGCYSTNCDVGENEQRGIVSQRWLSSRQCLVLATS